MFSTMENGMDVPQEVKTDPAIPYVYISPKPHIIFSIRYL